MELNLFVVSVTISVMLLTWTRGMAIPYTDEDTFIVYKDNYTNVLKLSLLYYEAQRSGQLPENNRISWRQDSALNDRGRNGEDLTGGYYDASDFIKFGFTMAYTTTILAWGAISWPQAYEDAHQVNEIRSTIKWATDYFIKCHVSEHELYGLIGEFDGDQQFWGRPEDLNTNRPAFKIDEANPGSDLAGETAAALAATSIVFRNADPEYSDKCLRHARQLFEFADGYRGFYDIAIPEAAIYYKSSNYGDELAWAAVWLYKATNESKYLDKAEQFYQEFNLAERPNMFFYDNKTAGVQVLLAQLNGKAQYRKASRAFCDFAIRQQKRTPKGLLYLDKFGTLSHAANVAFICLEAADLLKHQSQEYHQFAKQQIDYMLGGAGRSYVVGYGISSPTQPHHSASSCQKSVPCNWQDYSKILSNSHILYGALVSGPDERDQFVDRRQDYLYTEVTLDYNAGFTSALAGLLQLELNKHEA